MILILLIIIPLGAGILSWFLSRRNSRLPSWISLIALIADLGLALFIWSKYYSRFGLSGQGEWMIETNREWIPQLGINFHLALDSLSLILVSLTAFLGIMAVISSWT